MLLMLFGLVMFLGGHAFTTMRAQRAALIARIGEGPYKILYSLVSLAGVVLAAWGYADWRAAGAAQLWDPPLWTRYIAQLLMIVASVLIPAAYIPSHIRARLKHPMLTAIKTWAVAHLIANGDAATIVLSLAILGWAIYARVSMKQRDEPPPPAPTGWIGDASAVLAGLAVFLALAYLFHPYVVGVPAIP